MWKAGKSGEAWRGCQSNTDLTGLEIVISYVSVAERLSSIYPYVLKLFEYHLLK